MILSTYLFYYLFIYLFYYYYYYYYYYFYFFFFRYLRSYIKWLTVLGSRCKRIENFKCADKCVAVIIILSSLKIKSKWKLNNLRSLITIKNIHVIAWTYFLDHFVHTVSDMNDFFLQTWRQMCRYYCCCTEQLHLWSRIGIQSTRWRYGTLYVSNHSKLHIKLYIHVLIHLHCTPKLTLYNYSD